MRRCNSSGRGKQHRYSKGDQFAALAIRGKIMDYAGQKNERKSGRPCGGSPTAGTGSELSDGLVITSPEHVKCPILATNAMAGILFWILCLRWGCRQGLRRPREWMFWHTPWNPTHQRRRLSRQTRSAREIFVRSYNGCLWRCHIRTRKTANIWPWPVCWEAGCSGTGIRTQGTP